MSEYPKVIDVDGLKITAADEADEARWREKPAPRPDPLESVEIVMDNPAYNEPVKPKQAKATTKAKNAKPIKKAKR